MTALKRATWALACALTLCIGASVCAGTALRVRGNSMTINGKRTDILYRSSGDLDGDGRPETVFSVRRWDGGDLWGIIVARRTGKRWRYVTFEDYRSYGLRTDVTDVNGDHRDEVVSRGMSEDGHGICIIFELKGRKLLELGDFGDTRLRDLNGDRIPEVLSAGPISAGFVGDHWLTIYKWDGRKYGDVSRRFPREYDAIISDIRKVIHDLRYTLDYGERITPEHDPGVFADLYYYLGKAYEIRGLPAKAKVQYAIAERLRQ